MDGYPNTFFKGLRRTMMTFSHHYLAGLNPFVTLISNPGVCTRLLTAEERQRQQRYDQMNSEEKSLRYHLKMSKRRERTLKIGRHIFLLITRIVAQELRFEIEKQKEDNKELRADNVKQASRVMKVTLKMDELRRNLHDASQQLINFRNERDEALSMLQKEKRKCEAEQRHRNIAISSLRSRFQSEKTMMCDEVNALKYKIRNLELEIKEMQTIAHEHLQDIERLENTIARYEQNEMVSHLSQHLSIVLSDISAVALVRPADQETVEDKIRDIRECVRDMVGELQSRRRNVNRWRERVFDLEEEKMLWICNESRHEAEFMHLQKALREANREIEILRKEHHENGPLSQCTE